MLVNVSESLSPMNGDRPDNLNVMQKCEIERIKSRFTSKKIHTNIFDYNTVDRQKPLTLETNWIANYCTLFLIWQQTRYI